MMKKIYLFIACIFMLSHVNAQLVRNSSFEDKPNGNAWDISPWTKWTPDGAWIDVVDHDAKSGTYAIQLTGNECSIEQQIAGLKPNTAYVLEGWVKLKDFGQSVRLGLDLSGGSGGGFVLSSSTTYTKLSFKFTTGTGTTAKVYFYKPNIGSWAYGDDFSIREANAPAPNNSTLSFSPDQVSLIRNPGMGWTLYDDAADDVANATTYWARQGANADKYASTFYIRWRWAEMEPEEGKYAWLFNDNFKALVKGARDRKLKLAFRIYTDSQDNWHQSTPKYVFDAGAKSYKTSDGRNNDNPYLDDPVFQEKFTKFIQAFAKEFDDPAVVDYVDGYNFGWWGEGHSERYLNDAWESKTQVWRWVYDLYGSSFKRVIPVVTSNILHSTNYDILRDNAFIKNNYVPRRDGLGSKYITWEEEQLHNRLFPAAMFVGEQCYWGGSQEASPTWKPWEDQGDHTYPAGSTWKTTYQHTYNDAIKFHANYLDLREVAETEGWVKDAPELVQSFMVKGGYRLYPSSVSLPTTIKSGQPFRIGHIWKNIAIGVCPNNNKHWNNKYKVAFALLEPGTGVVKKLIIDPAANPANWIEGSRNEYDLDVTVSDISSGQYVFGAAIINSEDNNNPEIKLALQNPTLLSGWAKIADVTVTEPSEKLNEYRSTGDVDLGSNVNWEVYNGTAWVQSDASNPPSNKATKITILPGHRWSNNVAATVIPKDVQLINQSSLFGTFDPAHPLTNNGSVIFAAADKQIIPGASALNNGTWGNLIIDNPAGVKSIQSGIIWCMLENWI
ncbi:carbohydrate binding domain-containing protein [Dyadobacter sp. CY312]|uniref:carbohydrate binding domain-containing protein n=1 Tax=Dyadobacter sp. CY312 TaxID=2907303 RepID=UPI001F1612D4|nr:carbohydrate binding domain-containing protein [Dyadobacter sp. CY312]MCE7044249.1 carbohydrate binding domain-containing protein [Dyadobacter sp. CY312]